MQRMGERSRYIEFLAGGLGGEEEGEAEIDGMICLEKKEETSIETNHAELDQIFNEFLDERRCG